MDDKSEVARLIAAMSSQEERHTVAVRDLASEIERLRNEVSDLRAYSELAREKAREILGQQTKAKGPK